MEKSIKYYYILIHADNLTNLTNKMKDAKDKDRVNERGDFINKYKNISIRKIEFYNYTYILYM